MRERAFAKINLALHVRARRPDGYHDIETVFAFAEDGDELSAEEGEGIELDLRGPFAPALAGAANLVLRAARSLAERMGVARGVRLTLVKRLPVAAGIGGGSADAAAALRLLNRFWGLGLAEPELLDLARPLGADVPVCLLSRPARGEGRGDCLVSIENPPLPGAPLLLVNPAVALATPAVFSGWDGIDRGPLGDWREGRNDLEAPARRLAPEIGEVLESLAGAAFSRMSGSGPTCFGLYPDEAARDAAAAVIAAARPHWWTLATRLR